MRCFLGCFGASKDDNKRHKNSHNLNFSPNHISNAVKNQYNGVQTVTAAKQDYIEKPINLSSAESRVKQEEQPSLGTRKRVTFNSSVKEYEHVSTSEVPKIIQENEKGADVGWLKPSKSSSVTESGSTSSSSTSFPPNHRYENCRESDDEDEELDFEVSDLDEDEDGLSEDDNEEAYDAKYSDDEYYSRQVPEFSTRSCSSMDSEIKDKKIHDEQEKTPPLVCRVARDRAGYVHSVLNPIENTAQWKHVKSKQTPLLKQPKENFHMHLDSRQHSPNSKATVDEPENNHDAAVDASLSTWLISSNKTPQNKASLIGLEPISSAASSSSHGSNSVRSHEDRPILERTPIEQSGCASSFKGIPNTTSKYREDTRVKWHSTPFETRLERALNRVAADSRT